MKQRQTVSSTLTNRQRQVLDLVAKGHTNAEIGEVLGISPAGAKWHVGELLMKFDAESRGELVEKWAAETSVRARFAAIGSGFLALLQPKFAAMAGVSLVAVGVVAAVVAVGAVAVTNGSDEAAFEMESPTGVTREAKGLPLVYLNGDTSREWVNGYARAGGGLCLEYRSPVEQGISTVCRPQEALAEAVGQRGNVLQAGDGVPGMMRVTLAFPDTVASFDVTAGGSVQRFFPTPAPADLRVGLGFAYIELERLAQPAEIATYDAEGRELARWTEPRLRYGPPAP